jgi:hypothetical protein
MLLSKTAQNRAISFIKTEARPLEQAFLAFCFESGSGTVVLEQLAEFQNPDGGFG